MERRKAMAWSAAGALLLLSGTVAAGTGLLQGGEDAADTAVVTTTTTTAPLQPVVVTEVRDVYDTAVVPVPTAPVQTAAAAPPAAAPAPDPGEASTTAPLTSNRGGGNQQPEIPENWPPDQPLPPIPEGCREPHLEDNGVWNCQD